MPTIQKRGSRYTVTARVQGHPSISKTFNTKRLALKWGRDTEDAMKAGTFVSEKEQKKSQTLLNKHNPILADALDNYEQREAKNKRGYEQAKGRIRICRELDIAKKRLSEVTSADIVDIVEAWQDDGLSGDTIRSRLSHISNAYRRYQSRSGIKSPTEGVELPPLNDPRDRRLEGDEEARIFAAMAGTRWPLMAHFVTLALETAWRSGELRQLTWKDVNLDEGIITLRLTRSKTAKSRTTPLSPTALAALRELRRKTNGNGSVWGKEPSREVMAARWKRLAKRAGCEDLRFHDLRHEAISRLAEGGMDILHIAQFFSGHTSMRMLQRYAHLRDTKLVRRRLQEMHAERLAA